MDSPDAAGRSSGDPCGSNVRTVRGPRGFGARLARLLETTARRFVHVTAGDKFRSIDDEHYEIDPTRPEDYDRLFREVLGTKLATDWGVIHLWSLDQDLGLDASASRLADAQALGCLSVLHLTQALARRVGAVPPRLWLLTRGVQAIGPQPAPAAVAAAPIWGLGKVIGLEHPEFRCVRMDLDAERGADDVGLFNEEIGLGRIEPQVAFRQGRRYVARLAVGLCGSVCPGDRSDRAAAVPVRSPLSDYWSTIGPGALSQRVAGRARGAARRVDGPERAFRAREGEDRRDAACRGGRARRSSGRVGGSRHAGSIRAARRIRAAAFRRVPCRGRDGGKRGAGAARTRRGSRECSHPRCKGPGCCTD